MGRGVLQPREWGTNHILVQDEHLQRLQLDPDKPGYRIKLHKLPSSTPIILPTASSPWVWAMRGIDDARKNKQQGANQAGKERSTSLVGRYISPKELGYELPKLGVPEMAFAGRSNAGKSSLVGALMNNSGLVRSSKAPGCTRTMQYFGMLTSNDAKLDQTKYFLVDMPGYGYAARSRKESQGWGPMVIDYLTSGACSRVFVLVDGRHGMTDHDEAMMKALDKVAVPYQVVITKADLLSGHQIASSVETVARKIVRFAACYPVVHVTSAKKGYGMAELRENLFFTSKGYSLIQGASAIL
jgi:GTP-binding protein